MDSDGTEQDVSRGTSTPVAKLVTQALAEWIRSSCAVCGAEFVTRDNTVECPACREQTEKLERIDREAKLVLERADSWVEPWCAHAGMTKREATAAWAEVPAALKKLLSDPRLYVRDMVAGVTPSSGFGLMGPTGTGKTFALAAVCKAMALARWKRLAPTQGMLAKRQFARWVRWPEVVAEFRLRAMRDGSQDAVADMVDAWSEVEVLVLDDLGAERAKGDYSEEWTSSLLDLVVDRRYNEMRPTWWTANLAAQEFAARYGSRLWSRLTGANPAVLVPSGPDLRVVGEKGRES